MTLAIPGAGVTSAARLPASEMHRAESLLTLRFSAWFKLASHDSERENFLSGTHLPYFISPTVSKCSGLWTTFAGGPFSFPSEAR